MNPQVGFLLNKSLESLRNSNLESAELFLKQAIRLESNNPHVLRLLGVIATQREQYLDALKHFNNSLKALPKNSLTLSNLGNVFLELKEYDKALDAYDKSIKIDPKYEEAWSNKGNALYELKRFEEAIAHYDKALTLKPEYAQAWSNKGIVLNELKRYNEAITHFDQALTLKSDIDSIDGDLLHARMRICSWSSLVDSLEKISREVIASEKITSPFMLLALNNDTYLHKKSSENYIQDKYPFNSALGPIPKRLESQKIRVGYFSADFKNHPVAFLIAELFELHDKNKFETYAFSLASAADEMRARLHKAFDYFIDVEAKSDIETAKIARDLNIDIAIDLSGHTQDSRTGIFSYRAAPIQVNYLGYPGTMGANYIDYIVADNTIIPVEAQSYYSEKVIYLPYSYQVNDRKRLISDRKFTRQELGLPEDGFVFCCFNNNFKILPGTFASWMRVLRAVEGSILWLFQDNPWAAENLKKEAEKQGIAANRLVFAEPLPLVDHLARHRQADLFLDTYPYNAHTTSSDALWAGLPVLTLIGNSFASRVAASLLKAIGLPELVTNNQEEYEALAIELAMNAKKLAHIKLKLSENRLNAPLFDTPLFTKNLEAAYIKMYERYQADLQPDHIFIA